VRDRSPSGAVCAPSRISPSAVTGTAHPLSGAPPAGHARRARPIPRPGPCQRRGRAAPGTPGRLLVVVDKPASVPYNPRRRRHATLGARDLRLTGRLRSSAGAGNTGWGVHEGRTGNPFASIRSVTGSGRRAAFFPRVRVIPPPRAHSFAQRLDPAESPQLQAMGLRG
jgi:hypothetical protein